MANKTIGARIKLDGETEFRRAISEINAGLKVNKSEMELLIAQYRKNEESVEGLTAKGKALNNQINSQTDKISTLERALASSTKEYGEADKRTMTWQTSLNQAKTELIKMTDALEENNMTLGEAQAGFSDYDTSISDTSGQTKGFGNVLSQVFSEFGVDIGDFQSKTSDAFTQYKDGLSTSEQSTSKSSGIMATALGVAPVLAAGALVASIIEISKEVKATANEVKSSSDKMQISLGLTADEADEAAKSVKRIYTEGLTDDKKQAEEALMSVTRLMGLTGDEATQVAKRVLAIGAGGEDVKGITRSASTLMQQFGITSVEALDIIAGGLQTTANKNDDLLDVLNEYSSSFERMGYSADEFLGMIVSATDAGAYSADKSADVVKEFYNKAVGGSDAFSEALKGLGLNSEQTIKKITGGGDEARQTFERVSERFAKITDETKQAKIASELFGSQWEDVGTKATLALFNTSKEVVNYTGKAEESYNTLKDSSATFDKSVDRSFGNLGDVVKKASIDALNPLNLVKGLFKSINQGISEISERFKQTEKDGEAAGEASSSGYTKSWTSGEKQILDAVQKTANSSNSILSGIGSNINGGSSSSKQKIPPYALGTAYHSGGFARVNDRQNDPTSGEIIDLPTGSRVYPKGVSPSSGGDIFNITIDAKNVKDFNDIVTMAQAARQQRRSR